MRLRHRLALPRCFLFVCASILTDSQKRKRQIGGLWPVYFVQRNGSSAAWRLHARCAAKSGLASLTTMG
ncbi:hypothetical protein CDS [Bradyrhizobium sp.]|nr:hypothetical protein CDS [Bradyrhizobium sp.]